MSSPSGVPSHIGPYPIERELGRGGMGIVYLARDPRLGRQVAIKVLPADVSQDPDRLARFDREAKMLAALNHPNVGSIYSVEEAAGLRFITMEYIGGEGLDERLRRGPLSIGETLELGRQVAAALEAAHEAGVIHRDLKPANVKFTPGGEVKVLDFGLAKGGVAGAGSGSDINVTHSPTISIAATLGGVILGTAAYMSPEQARGKPLDRRTDIWSFGCLLYECLTGRQLFEGETVSDTIARILEREPDWTLLPANTPEKLRALLRHCLEKDAKKRQRDMGDARLELEEILASRTATGSFVGASATTSGVAKTTRKQPALSWALAAVTLLVGAAAGLLAGRGGLAGGGAGGASGGPVALSIAVPAELQANAAAISPDGTILSLIARRRAEKGAKPGPPQIFLRRINAYELVPVPGSEGANASYFSADSKWLSFVAKGSPTGTQFKLYKVRTDLSSPPVALADWAKGWSSFAWLDDGRFVISDLDGHNFHVMPPNGGSAVETHRVQFPDSETVFDVNRRLIDHRNMALATTAEYVNGNYKVGVAAVDLTSGKATRILDDGDGAYIPPGYFLFARADKLLASKFDPASLKLKGETVALLDGLRTRNSWDPAGFRFSRNGTLVYAPGGQIGSQRQLIVVTPGGESQPWAEDKRAFAGGLNVSRDGRKVAVIVASAGGVFEVWTGETGRNNLHRTVAVSGEDCDPGSWTPDGRYVAYVRSGRTATAGCYLQEADASSEPRKLASIDMAGGEYATVRAWTPDGSTVLGRWNRKDGNADLSLIRTSGPDAGKLIPLLATSATESDPELSPDGRWLAYRTDERGKPGLFVAEFRVGGGGQPASLGPATQVTDEGENHAWWSADGKRLYYADAANVVQVVPVSEAGGALVVGMPTAAWDLNKLQVIPGLWSVMRDGRLIAVTRGPEEDEVKRFDVIVGWGAVLKEKLK